MTDIRKAASRAGLAASVALGAALLAQVGHAQAPAQANPDSARLTTALRTLAQNPQSLDALVAAGEASLRLDDIEAASGFFRRAEALNAQDGRVKAGLAAVMVRQRQPLDALRLFAEAEQAGALGLNYLPERGLAYDLIGDNARAQRDYATALAAGPDPAISRRLALSQAIGGDGPASEATLLPLLQRQDLAAYRTRAFALAVLGKGDEAVSIAETMLPNEISNRMAPYLRYMPRLTRAQQAAAANLGAFPRAGDIGRDDPAVLAYAASIGTAQPVRTADARLVPSGAPLGNDSAVRRRDEAPSTPPRPAPTPAPAVARATTQPAAPAQSLARAAPEAATPTPAASRPVPAQAAATPSSRMLPERARAMLDQHPELARPTSTVPPVRVAAATPTPAPAATSPTVTSPVVPTSGAPALSVRVAETAAPPPATVVLRQAPAPEPTPAVVAAQTPASVPAAIPAVERASGQATVATATEAARSPSAPPALSAPRPSSATPAAAATPRATNLSEAFADLRAPGTATPAPSAGTGAVDITKIQPRREQAASARPVAPPKPPPVPSRQWVQVATGRDTRALAFDWRRIKREAGGLLDRQTPSTADWGQTNRLVIGPFASASAADQMIAKLKDKKIDAFRFTSDVGEDVKPLAGG